MDQKPGNIDQDVRDIVETRAAISQKLELLRQRARYTVDASKASVDHLITHVRDTAQGGSLIGQNRESIRSTSVHSTGSVPGFAILPPRCSLLRASIAFSHGGGS
jgi:hypothetical protein